MDSLNRSSRKQNIPLPEDTGISAVIPVYNRPEFIRRSVESVFRQTTPPTELIVVDDGSTDETPDALAALRKTAGGSFRIITHRENRGVSAARNTGIRAAEAEWIALLDSDDVWHPEKLARQMAYHRDHPALRISQCNEQWIRHGKRVNKRNIHRKIGGRIFVESLKRCLVSPSAVVMHRTLFDEIGYFDESLPACEDYDLWLRVLVRYPIGLLDEPMVTRYGGHPDQLSARYWGMDRWRVQAMEKHVDRALPAGWKTALYRELVAKLEILYQGAAKRDKPEAERYREKLRKYRGRWTN